MEAICGISRTMGEVEKLSSKLLFRPKEVGKIGGKESKRAAAPKGRGREEISSTRRSRDRMGR